MARRRRHNRNKFRKRDLIIPSLPPMRRLLPVPVITTLRPTAPMRRLRQKIPRRTVLAARAAKTKIKLSRNHFARIALEAVDPRTRVCLKRKIRREVIHAKGKGGGNHRRRYKRTDSSLVRC